MQHGDPVAREVGDVEGQDAVDAVRQHRCDQTGIIDLGAQHSMGYDEALPYRIDRRIVCRQFKQPFDRRNFGRDGRSAKAKTVGRSDRPRRRRLEFGNVLGRYIKRLAGKAHSGDAVVCRRILPMVRLRQAQQHVGIDEDAHRPRGRL